jgi:hypothetical protein
MVLFGALIAVVGVVASGPTTQPPLYKQRGAPIEARVADLLGRMSIEVSDRITLSLFSVRAFDHSTVDRLHREPPSSSRNVVRPISSWTITHPLLTNCVAGLLKVAPCNLHMA